MEKPCADRLYSAVSVGALLAKVLARQGFSPYRAGVDVRRLPPPWKTLSLGSAPRQDPPIFRLFHSRFSTPQEIVEKSDLQKNRPRAQKEPKFDPIGLRRRRNPHFVLLNSTGNQQAPRTKKTSNIKGSDKLSTFSTAPITNTTIIYLLFILYIFLYIYRAI